MPIRSPATNNRRERAREHARRDILVAAAGVFARRGYAAATLAELADAAGFAAPSLYRYFQSKEEIFRSLVDLLLAEFGATFEAPVDRALPLPTRVAVLLDGQARLAEHHRHLITLLRMAETSDAPADARRQLVGPHAGLAFYVERMAGWLRRNTARGELRVTPELAARVLAGVAFAFQAASEAGGPGVGESHDLVDTVLHGIAAPAAPGRR